MSDLVITRSGEFMVTQVEGETEAGIEFVDSWNQPNLIVVDAGRIILPTDGAQAIEEAAEAAGLSISHEAARV